MSLSVDHEEGEREADRPEPASLSLSVDRGESERYSLLSFSLAFPAPSVYAKSVSSLSVDRGESERYSLSSFSLGFPAPSACVESGSSLSVGRGESERYSFSSFSSYYLLYSNVFLYDNKEIMILPLFQSTWGYSLNPVIIPI